MSWLRLPYVASHYANELHERFDCRRDRIYLASIAGGALTGGAVGFGHVLYTVAPWTEHVFGAALGQATFGGGVGAAAGLAVVAPLIIHAVPALVEFVAEVRVLAHQIAEQHKKGEAAVPSTTDSLTALPEAPPTTPKLKRST